MTEAPEICQSSELRERGWRCAARELFRQQRERSDSWMDRSMAALFVVQWALQVVLAIWVCAQVGPNSAERSIRTSGVR